MTFGSFLSLGAGLAVVLGLLAVVVRVLKNVRPDLVAPKGGPSLKVLSRQPLSPRQGVAVTRFQDRILLLSYGEGGVRLITEAYREDENGDATAETQTPDSTDIVPDPCGVPGQTPNDRSFPNVWNRVRKAAGLSSTVTLLLLGAIAFSAATVTPVPVLGQVVSATPPAAPLTDNPTGAENAVLDLARQLPAMDLQIGEEDGLSITGPVGTVLFIGFLTLLPTVLLMMTGFTRILVVLHLLKQAMGTQTAPPAHLLAAMALLLTGFVMAPTLSEVNQQAIGPWMSGEMDEVEMMKTASGPFRTFMLSATEETELATFMDLHGSEAPETVDQIPLLVITSAFVTSELRHAFQIGFALFLPFVVIDIVVASVLMSMGMFMLPPVMVSLPFKLLLFVLVDGWSLVVSGLVQSFA